jgi:hypothetical protein
MERCSRTRRRLQSVLPPHELDGKLRPLGETGDLAGPQQPVRDPASRYEPPHARKPTLTSLSEVLDSTACSHGCSPDARCATDYGPGGTLRRHVLQALHRPRPVFPPRRGRGRTGGTQPVPGQADASTWRGVRVGAIRPVGADAAGVGGRRGPGGRAGRAAGRSGTCGWACAAGRRHRRTERTEVTGGNGSVTPNRVNGARVALPWAHGAASPQ